MAASKLAISLVIFSGIIGMAISHTILEEYHCRDSAVEYFVSLKGGKRAGIFRTLGTAKNIQDCILKCCGKEKCDVAMLEGKTKTCIGVRCINDTQCETVPMAPGEEEDLQIAHVSARGLGNIHIDNKTRTLKTENSDERCPHNEIMYNMKLSGGLMAGKFIDVGRVKGINTCIRLCCDAKVDCDLSFMLGKRCYLVKCYDEDKCEALPSSGADYKFKQRMAFVSPWLYGKKKKIVKVPSSLSPHHVKCTQSQLYSGVRLLNGGDAGDFTDVGKVGKMHICARLCCEAPTCDVAYMFGKNCFLVKCYNEESCRVLPDEQLRSGSQQAFDKQVQYILRRNFNYRLKPDGSVDKQAKKCALDGDIRNATILSQGMLAGSLTLHKDSPHVNDCIEKCCDTKRCHVALMLGGLCYSMECSSREACKPKGASPEVINSKNPIVAFVKRGQISMAPKLEDIQVSKQVEKPGALTIGKFQAGALAGGTFQGKLDDDEMSDMKLPAGDPKKDKQNDNQHGK